MRTLLVLLIGIAMGTAFGTTDTANALTRQVNSAREHMAACAAALERSEVTILNMDYAVKQFLSQLPKPRAQ